MVDWQLALTIVAIVLGGSTIVLALRLSRRKNPVWAGNTTRIIGLGTTAPPELQMTFDGTPVNDVYRTVLIFLNKGRETIRETDVTQNVVINFEGGEILRPPTILAKSREANKFLPRQLHEGQVIELTFLYLDHNDGAVVEVLHTKSPEIRCSGDIMGTDKIGYVGRFVSPRHKSLIRVLGVLSLLVILPLFVVLALMKYLLGMPIPTAVMGILAGWTAASLLNLPGVVRLLKFPKWSRGLGLNGEREA